MGFLLALVTAILSGVAAYYWFKASAVTAIPTWMIGANPSSLNEPLDPAQSQGGWIAGLVIAAQQSSKLNKLGALWSGLAAASGALSALAGSSGY